MNVFVIAWRSIQYRGLGSVLSIVSMALGVMLVVAVLSIQSIVSKSFRSNTSFGYNVIVGSKGGSTQLTLNTVFYLSKPTGNIPYEYYLAFRQKEDRNAEMKNSIQYQHDQAVSLSRQCSLQQSPFGGGLTELGLHMQNVAMEEGFVRRARLHKNGTFGSFCALAIPLALGDYFGEEGAYFRVVGTTPDFFTELELNVDTGEKFEFADGRPFETYTRENRYFEAVLGANVARKSGVRVGDDIYPIHGDPNSEGAHTHQQGFKVVGILEATGTSHDRAVFVNLEGFFLMEDHVKPIEEDRGYGEEDDDEGDDEFLMDEAASLDPVRKFRTAGELAGSRLSKVALVQTDDKDSDSAAARQRELAELQANDGLDPLPIEQREVTSILVRTQNDPYGMAKEVIVNGVNSNRLESTLNWSDYRPLKDSVNDAAEAANPIEEVTKLFVFFVNPIRWLLLILTTMICVVSGISILVGIYNSMAQRRHEIAVIRALGARRETVMAITLIETAMLALAGGAVGWLAGHVLNWLASGMVETYAGVRIGLFTLAPIELVLLPSLLFLAVIVGIYPAISAYRTDVAKSLGA